jgi:hypothetical protein
MTVVIEGHMRIQFFKADGNGALIPDGIPVDLKAGQTGLIEANRVYVYTCVRVCVCVCV